MHVVVLVEYEATLARSILQTTQHRCGADLMVIVRFNLLVAQVDHIDTVLGEDHEVLRARQQATLHGQLVQVVALVPELDELCACVKHENVVSVRALGLVRDD